MTAFETSSQFRRQTAPEFFAFESGLQAAAKHRSQHRLEALLAQWDVLLGMYKHGFEIPRLLGLPHVTEDHHRVVLTGLLTMGENIWLQAKELDDEKLAKTGYEREFISANLAYLRGKYQDWYGLKDEVQARQDLELMMTDEIATASH